jgi:hypothetical protein
MKDRAVCSACGAVAYGTTYWRPAAEYPPCDDLPAFTFSYTVPFLGLIERRREVSVPFSYINGTLLEVRRYEDMAHLSISSCGRKMTILF